MTKIICAVLDFFKLIVVKLFPDLSVGSDVLGNISSGLVTVVEFIAKANFFIPVPTILLILSLVYGFKLVKFTLFLANWVIRRIADIIP